jgi:hypothetical protein
MEGRDCCHCGESDKHHAFWDRFDSPEQVKGPERNDGKDLYLPELDGRPSEDMVCLASLEQTYLCNKISEYLSCLASKCA